MKTSLLVTLALVLGTASAHAGSSWSITVGGSTGEQRSCPPRTVVLPAPSPSRCEPAQIVYVETCEPPRRAYAVERSRTVIVYGASSRCEERVSRVVYVDECGRPLGYGGGRGYGRGRDRGGDWGDRYRSRVTYQLVDR